LRENILNNVAGKGKQFFAPVTLNQSALGITDGKVELFEPDGFRDNEGIAFLANTTRQPTAKGISYSVDLRRLDSFFHSDTRFGTVKIDVEGAEFEVLRGAEMLLSKRSIRDIVFEDFQPFPSETSILLLDYGYRIYRLVKTIFGPVLWDMLDPGVKYNLLPWEPVNYLATLDPDRALIRFRQKGWLCLRRFPLR
jgi:FkbM family methyltransferase